MRNLTINRLFGLSASLSVLLMATSALAQTSHYPTKPIKIIVPFTAGGVVDTITRIIGGKLATEYGQSVIVENRPGAGGSIGTEYVARSKPDGYTLLSVSPGHAVAPSIIKHVAWSPVKDFRAVEEFGIVPNVFVVKPDLPVKNMPELIAMARASSKPLTYATAGIGTSNHLSGLLLAQMAHVKLEQVPYRGQPNALNDVLAGRVTTMPLTIALAGPYIKAGKLRGLAVTTATRATEFPNIPTVAESANLPGYAVGTWFGFVAPKKVPDAIVQKLSADIVKILAMPDVKKQLAGIGMEMAPENPQQFDVFIASEYSKWGRILKQAGVTPQ
ncbi:MAG: tripartite tricarboxylate transporter substrate binding protein [Candidimonas sp.]|nr:MAG: tripartite tricarboxylate transporter substrate binding protein [Candidimonas sp.]TAM19093.1 MAG: tripartite tricarboxylate transporter substrate binding protein [Candidimonas sp.]TAM80737.1 MAG: tripartite tricarboxylate transporter substrate binding protein [Candidimonas sp.]